MNVIINMKFPCSNAPHTSISVVVFGFPSVLVIWHRSVMPHDWRTLSELNCDPANSSDGHYLFKRIILWIHLWSRWRMWSVLNGYNTKVMQKSVKTEWKAQRRHTDKKNKRRNVDHTNTHRRQHRTSDSFPPIEMQIIMQFNIGFGACYLFGSTFLLLEPVLFWLVMNFQLSIGCSRNSR